MSIIRKTESQIVIYEHTELDCLVAIDQSNKTAIKKFWKENKGKSTLLNDTVAGHKFVMDENQESLRIDFEHLDEFEIRYLKKYT